MIYPGSKFSGFQSSNNAANGIGGMNISDDQRYEVNVEFQTVNLADSMATGYLTISNLTTVPILIKKSSASVYSFLGISRAYNLF